MREGAGSVSDQDGDRCPKGGYITLGSDFADPPGYYRVECSLCGYLGSADGGATALMVIREHRGAGR